jgi:probable lipoprotein NlpC
LVHTNITNFILIKKFMSFFIRNTQSFSLFCLFLCALGCTQKNYSHLKIPAQATKTEAQASNASAIPGIPLLINQEAITRVAADFATYKANVQKVVKNVRSYIGTSYKFGGLNYKGIDCSGLVHVCLLEINKNIARMPDEQIKQGVPVDRKALRVGDLVFFGAGKNSTTITHVGIVTEVVSTQKVLFVHASGKRGVVEDNFFHYHWQEVFIAASRPNYYQVEDAGQSIVNNK